MENLNRYYAGIGSRETPLSIMNLMERIAISGYENGWTLRSGGAKGADTAFYEGGYSRCEIFRAGHATDKSIQLAANYHPAWERCKDYARKLHGRNTMIILGQNLDTPVEVVYCWTANGKDAGGTGLGIRLALDKKIPVVNLYYDKLVYQIEERLENNTLWNI